MCVVVDNRQDMNRISILLGLPLDGRTDRPIAPLRIRVITADSPDLNWETLTLRGARECVVLCDHHAIEDRFATVLQMLHAYDAPAPVQASAPNPKPQPRR